MDPTWFTPVIIGLFALVAALFVTLGVVHWRERPGRARQRTHRRQRSHRGAHSPTGRAAVSALTVEEIRQRLREE